jgi:hypothetical protein
MQNWIFFAILNPQFFLASTYIITKSLSNLKCFSKTQHNLEPAMQFKSVSNGFILNAYCKNELHDMKNESNE